MFIYVQSYKPPLTCPFVQIADMEREVIVVTTPASSIMSVANPIPA